MSEPEIGIGNPEAQRSFLKTNAAFMKEYAELQSILNKVFIRTLWPPSADILKSLDGLPDDAPAVVAIDSKWLADQVVFSLGRVAAEDFGELFLLTANGSGIGALTILRRMYERIVTAAFIAKNTSEVHPFIEDEAIKKWKLWQRLVDVAPGTEARLSGEEIDQLKTQYAAAISKRKESICSKCHQPKTQDAWTRVDLATMATKASPTLASLYPFCYLLPTFHAHATSFSLSVRIKQVAGMNTFKESSETDARNALILGHNLILQLLRIQDEYFNFGFEAEIQERLNAFALWDGAKPL